MQAVPLNQRRVILGDAFRRVIRRGEWLWPHRNLPLSPGPHLQAGAIVDASAASAEAAPESVQS